MEQGCHFPRGKKIFINDLLETLTITLRNLCSLSEWWDDALWDSISQLAFTLLSEVIRDAVKTAGTQPSILQHIWAAAKPGLVSASLYSTHLPQGINKVLQFPPQPSWFCYASPCPDSSAFPTWLEAKPFFCRVHLEPTGTESSCFLSHRCLGGKWCVALSSC